MPLIINRFVLQECGKVVETVLLCEELVGEVNHTTECVTDLETSIRVKWIIM